MHQESDPTRVSRGTGADTAPPGETGAGTGATAAPGFRLEGARLRSLVGLLDDDSPAVLRGVHAALLAAGPGALGVLRAAERAVDPRRRGRARELRLAIERQGILRRLLRRAADPDLDLESSLFLLGRIESPDLDARPYLRALDAMGREVSDRARRESDDITRPMVLCEYLGNELGFVGAEVDYDHPDHIHLHRALETKRGMPLTLSALYLFVARRAGLKASILPLPGHVLLRIRAGRRALIVDPFHGGRIRRRSDCVRYLAQHGMVPQPSWFREASDSALFQRHLLNLMSSLQDRGRTRLSRALHRVARAAAHASARAEEPGRP